MQYLDTSCVVPLFVPEPASVAAATWFEECNELLVSADWMMVEFSSALSMKVQRKELSQKQALSAWNEFEVFCQSGLRLIAVSRTAYKRAALLAGNGRSGLRAGDSLHLAVAVECGATGMVTADDVLLKNAQRQGLVVTTF